MEPPPPSAAVTVHGPADTSNTHPGQARRRTRPPRQPRSTQDAELAGEGSAPTRRSRGPGRNRAGAPATPASHADSISQTAPRADGDVTQQIRVAFDALNVSSAQQGPQLLQISGEEGSQRRRPVRRRRPRKDGEPAGPAADGNGSAGHSATSTDVEPHEDGQTPRPTKDSRRRRFGTQLTSGDTSAPSTSSRPHPHAHPLPPPNADLATRITHNLTHPPYADCPICFSSIHPAQPVWSCTPSPALGVVTSCWTPFHLKCIREWASKSVHDTREAWRARGEDREGDWRCPGCQTKRMAVPVQYRCFCDRLYDPKPGRLATPHSCGEKCSRPRGICEHPCPLLCHPGPCPPCIVTVQRPCYCGAQTLALRCSHLTSLNPPSLSCGNVCSKTLNCGKHKCALECHPGDCGACDVREEVRCYCGKENKEVGCGEGEAKECVESETGEKWEGRFECENVCGRPFKCGVHHCEKRCHVPPIESSPCPADPSVVAFCPCGKTVLETLPGGHRTKCTDPIPTCSLPCSKPLPYCIHVCPLSCHTGDCPPCAVEISLSCRCGETVRVVPCWKASSSDPDEQILCDRPCRAMRHCGRHVCGRVCCPLAWQGKVAKGKRKAMETAILGRPEQDPEGWHDCDVICGKLLTCKNHHCTLPDHRGPCPTCLQSSFDELVCHCGRTVLMPPIPCGTVISCPFPCSRPAPQCGHPKTDHACHEEGECPPCPFLTSKRCACGKTMVPNVRCSQEKVGCGIPCAKLLDCGFHSCEKLCHSGDCESCTQTCGKPRKLCAHPCPMQCHAPSACPEVEPCPARVIISCACGRIKQAALCGACISQPTSKADTQLKCNSDCALAKRNARLAEALGIQEGSKSKLASVEWPERLIAFWRENKEWAAVAEKNLNDFITGPKKTQVLPQMVAARQRFVHEMANIYRIDVDYVDTGVNRSVQLVRRVDSRIPSPLLSEAAGSQPQGRTGLVSLSRPRPAAVAAPRTWATLPTTKPVAAVVASSTPPSTSTSTTPTPAPAVRASTTERRLPSALPARSTAAPPAPAQITSVNDESVRDSWEDDED